MPGKIIRDIVNLLLYGGAFIGLCASTITALTFELTGTVNENMPYILLIGTATAALYSAHRVIGLHKLKHITTYGRFTVIRKYKYHIWLYCLGWTFITAWQFFRMFNISFFFWLIPGGSIALGYVLPLLSKGRRLRDMGWIKIVLIGWSWGWLTAFIPAYYFHDIDLIWSIIITLERILFIIAITIPFEIRDVEVDSSTGLLTVPSRFGHRNSLIAGYFLCGLVVLFSILLARHYHDHAYWISMTIVSAMTVWIIQKSASVKDDYFFSGLTDGLMIIVLLVYSLIK